jgi:uncharacterized membrane protein YqjE
MGVQIYDPKHVPGNGGRLAPSAAEDHRSLPQLLRDLSQDSVHLMRQEVQLFRVETEQKLTVAQRHALVLGAGGMIAYLGLLSLTAATIMLLALAIPAWLSALLVGVALCALGAVALIVGKNRLASEELAPKETMRSVKQDVRTFREAV